MDNDKKTLTIINGTHILGPSCGELISPMDIEAYRQCPYCGFIFEQTPEFEDFVLSPITRQWTKSVLNQFLR